MANAGNGGIMGNVSTIQSPMPLENILAAAVQALQNIAAEAQNGVATLQRLATAPVMPPPPTPQGPLPLAPQMARSVPGPNLGPAPTPMSTTLLTNISIATQPEPPSTLIRQLLLGGTGTLVVVALDGDSGLLLEVSGQWLHRTVVTPYDLNSLPAASSYHNGLPRRRGVPEGERGRSAGRAQLPSPA
jgi:hypothetical protein